MRWIIENLKEMLLVAVLAVIGLGWVLWKIIWFLLQMILLPFRYWKSALVAVLVGGLSLINITSFLASASREALLDFEMAQAAHINDAQRFAQRALGIAELETVRANDLEARLELQREELQAEREWNEELRARLAKAGIHVTP
jgi:hypothetical protein